MGNKRRQYYFDYRVCFNDGVLQNERVWLHSSAAVSYTHLDVYKRQVETQFGYHIINIEDKKSGSMGYKVANLVKAIKPSDKTENEVYTKATKFIQQVQGKSFNDFANLAKKNNYNFSNPKEIGRFQGQLPGLGTDKDEEVIAWAFNKKRNKGDTCLLYTSRCV